MHISLVWDLILTTKASNKSFKYSLFHEAWIMIVLMALHAENGCFWKHAILRVFLSVHLAVIDGHLRLQKIAHSNLWKFFFQIMYNLPMYYKNVIDRSAVNVTLCYNVFSTMTSDDISTIFTVLLYLLQYCIVYLISSNFSMKCMFFSVIMNSWNAKLSYFTLKLFSNCIVSISSALVEVINSYREKMKDNADITIYPPIYFNPFSWQVPNVAACKTFNKMSDEDLIACKNSFRNTSYVIQYHVHSWDNAQFFNWSGSYGYTADMLQKNVYLHISIFWLHNLNGVKT